jgi:hypothetical protein
VALRLALAHKIRLQLTEGSRVQQLLTHHDHITSIPAAELKG